MNNLNHVAIIMDGNGRWAKAKGLARLEGHRQGLAVAEQIIDHCLHCGIKYISLYVFSTENWKRPQKEIDNLFALAGKYIDKFQKFCKNRIRVVVSGEKCQLPDKLAKKIKQIESETMDFDAICVNLCINYGGQKDIVRSVRYLCEHNLDITEQSIAQNLYNSFIPAPDIILRTGGQKRLSNFLLYQSAYAELYFTDTLWPDFSVKELDAIISDYEKRIRNFGGLVNAE